MRTAGEVDFEAEINRARNWTGSANVPMKPMQSVRSQLDRPASGRVKPITPLPVISYANGDSTIATDIPNAVRPTSPAKFPLTPMRRLPGDFETRARMLMEPRVFLPALKRQAMSIVKPTDSLPVATLRTARTLLIPRDRMPSSSFQTAAFQSLKPKWIVPPTNSGRFSV